MTLWVNVVYILSALLFGLGLKMLGLWGLLPSMPLACGRVMPTVKVAPDLQVYKQPRPYYLMCLGPFPKAALLPFLMMR